MRAEVNKYPMSFSKAKVLNRASWIQNVFATKGDMFAFMNRKITSSEVLYDRMLPEMSAITKTAQYRRAINSFCS